MKRTSLCYIEKDGKYLMLYRNKKKNDPNEGKWIGVGGHFEAGEGPEECVIREVREETGYKLTSYIKRGLIHFRSDMWEDEDMYLFTADAFEVDNEAATAETITEMGDGAEGTPYCDEGELKWIDKADVMGLNLWEGDRKFLELLTEDRPFFEMMLTYQGEKLTGCSVEYK